LGLSGSEGADGGVEQPTKVANAINSNPVLFMETNYLSAIPVYK
jgi:hypothetical protein